jgi:hypothetical protein
VPPDSRRCVISVRFNQTGLECGNEDGRFNDIGSVI